MEISTSILNATNRKESIEKLNKTITNYVHIDVMDGLFVQNTQFNNVKEIYSINKESTHPLDIHLMVENPINYIKQFNNMNIEYITFHIEVEKNIKELISLIKEKGYKVGISIKPNTNIDKIIPFLKYIDLVLIMSVEPGKGGQQFISITEDRVKEIKRIINQKNYNIKIEVDGGINDKTITKIMKSDIAVVGSYITKSSDYSTQIKNLLLALQNKK